MKRVLISMLAGIFLLTVVISCSNHDIGEGEDYTCKSYITSYVKCDCIHYIQSGSDYIINEEERIYHQGRTWDSSGENIVLSVGAEKTENDQNTFSYTHLTQMPPPIPSAEYNKYMEEVGDTSYNMTFNSDANPKGAVIVICVPLKSVVITSDKNFGVNYPTGTNLNQFFSIIFDNVYASIRNGYVRVDGSYRRSYESPESLTSLELAKLSEINLEEYPFIEAKWDFLLYTRPEETDIYTFHVKLTFVDGTVLEGDAPPVTVKGRNL